VDEGIIYFWILAVIVLGIIALVRASRARKLAKRNEENCQNLTQRVYALETLFQELRGRLKEQTSALEMALQQLRRLAIAREGPAPAEAAPPEPTKPPVVAVGAEVPSIEPPRPAATLAPSAPGLTVPPAAAAIPKPTVLPASTARTAALPPTEAPAPPIAPPHLDLLGKPQPLVHETAKRVSNMEEVLGTNWLNKIGMIILVIGVALFLAYEMRAVGPAGKVLVGFMVSAAFLGAGIFFERREQWRILARAGMGGGWALLYFTTYAMNHIGAARILESEAWDFVFLLIVAAAMVAHTLRYNSRVVTGLAFLLAFSTVNINYADATGHADATSLIASAILAVALVVIVGKRRWFDLEVLAIAAIFLNHYLWLRPIIEPMGGHRHHFPEFFPSVALLVVYWLVFRISYLQRSNVSEEEERVSTFAAILNTSLLLGIMKYQSVHPEWAFYALLVLGAIEFTLGQLPIARRRRAAFVVLSILGATLMVAAIPFKYSGERVPILWLAEAEALFLAGVFTREILFRWLGIAVELLVAGHLFFVDTRHLFNLREAQAADFSDLRQAMVFAVAALVLFANAHWVPRHWPDFLQSEFEKKFYRLQSYLGGFLMLAAIWAVCTEPWLGVGFAAGALLLAVVGARLKIEELSVLANSFTLLAFLRVVFANFAVVDVWHVDVWAVAAISLTAALLYVASRWIGYPAPVRTYRIPEIYTWLATLVVALLAWYQLWPASVGMAWALLGLVLFQLGFERRSASLRLQGYALFIASFFRILFVNFNAEGMPGQLSPRLVAALPLAVLYFFVYGRLEHQPEEFLKFDARLQAGDLHCYLGTLTVAAAVRFELGLDWIAAAWSALALLCVLIAWRSGRRIFLSQALLLSAGVFFRSVLHNFYQRSYFPPPSFWSGRWACVGSTIVVMFLALLVARRMKQPRPEGALAEGGRFRRAFAGLYRNPAPAFFFVWFILLTGLLYVELHTRGMSTVAWGAEAVGVFLFALAMKERTYRLSALSLLLICVVKIVTVDVWGLSPRDRYLTFIALGAALLAVSFLYTRYKEILRAYL
jgi:uncharacterized membrane protein